MLMFLAKCSDETPENRRMAQQLVESWSRPLVAARAQERQEEEAGRKDLEARGKRAEAALLAPRPKGISTARIPEAAAMDYTIRPTTENTMGERGSKQGKVTSSADTLAPRANAALTYPWIADGDGREEDPGGPWGQDHRQEMSLAPVGYGTEANCCGMSRYLPLTP